MSQRVSPPWQRRPARKLRRRQEGYLGIGVRRVLNGGASSGAVSSSLGFNFSAGSVVDTRSGIVPTFTRATTKTQTDWEGKPSTALSGEVVSEGLRRVRNLCTFTEAFQNAAWTKTVSGDATTTATDAAGTAPDGTATATRLQLNRGSANANASNVRQALGTAAPNPHDQVGSVWMKSNDGSTYAVALYDSNNGPNAGVNCSVTPTWQRFQYRQNAVPRTNCDISIGIGSSFTPATVTADILVWHPQMEDVTGQSNQNPSEYVSVGVLSTPFHGAKTDGTKYFPYLNGNTVAANVVTEATGASIPPITGVGIGWLPGQSGSYFSTPDAAANSITGNIDVRAYIAAADWTPAAERTIVAKWTTAGAQRTYALDVLATGVLKFYISTTGADSFSWNSTVAPTITDGVGLWVRAFRTASTGNVIFYTSQDNLTWTQLGTTVAGTSGNIFDSAAILEIGSIDIGGAQLFAMSVYRVQVYNDTALAVDFASRDWSTGTTFVSSTTGETWTLNGGARVFKWANGYYPEVAGTNVAIQAEDWATTWVPTGTNSYVAAAKMCGNIKLALMGDTDAGVATVWIEPVTFTGDGVKSWSIFFSQGSATSSAVRIRDTTAPANRLLAAITWTNGIPTITMTFGTLIRAPVPMANGCWRAEVLTTSVTAANAHNIEWYPATDAALGVAATGTIYAGGVQAENNAERVSSYVPTTTAAVTRNKDDMAVTTLGAWFNAAAGSVVTKGVTGASSAGAQSMFTISDGTTNEEIAHYWVATTTAQLVQDGGVVQSNITAGALPVFTNFATGVPYAVNDFALIRNGTVTGTDVSGTLPTPTQLQIGQRGGLTQFNALISSFDYYPSRIPNATLQVLAAAP